MSTEKERDDDWPAFKTDPQMRGRREPGLSDQEKAIQRCGKGLDYDHCTKAGSVYCEWECPLNPHA